MVRVHSSEASVAGRTPVFIAAQLNLAAQVSIAGHEPQARISLRLRAHNAVTTGYASSMLLPMNINSCVVQRGQTVARLGPDEWLILNSDGDGDGERLTAEFDTALHGTTFAVTDISHRNAGIAVAGARAREVINGGCPLDLSDARFPPGSATRTLLGKTEIVLLRSGVEPVYRVECLRSFAAYVYALLAEVSREFDPSHVRSCEKGVS